MRTEAPPLAPAFCSAAGHKAEQILAGKKAAGSIPIDTLQRFSLVVNMNTAQSLRVYPPMDLIPIAELLVPAAK